MLKYTLPFFSFFVYTFSIFCVWTKYLEIFARQALVEIKVHFQINCCYNLEWYWSRNMLNTYNMISGTFLVQTSRAQIPFMHYSIWISVFQLLFEYIWNKYILSLFSVHKSKEPHFFLKCIYLYLNRYLTKYFKYVRGVWLHKNSCLIVIFLCQIDE